MKVPKLQYHLGRPTTPAAQRRSLNRLSQNVNNLSGDIANASNTPMAGHACRLYNPSPTTFSTTVTSNVTWGSSSFDTDSWHSNSVNPGRVTVTQKGIYLVQAVLYFQAPSGVTQTNFIFQKNGSTIGTLHPLIPASVITQLECHTTLALSNGDYLSLQFLYTGDATLPLQATGEYDCFLCVSLLGTN